MTLLKHIASVRVSNVDKKSYTDETAVRLCNYTDVYYGDEVRADTGEYMVATASTEQVRNFGLREGDTVLTKDSETADDIGVSAYIADTAPNFVCGYHLAIARPDVARVDPKFLFWSTRSTAFRNQLSVAATGVTRYGLRTDALANTELSLPSLGEQRRIADFLDDQVARLDRAISLRHRHATLLARWLDAQFLEVLRDAASIETQGLDPSPLRGDWLPLSRILAQLTNGYVGPTRELLADEGVPYLQSLHIRRGGIDFARRPYFVPQPWIDERPRIRLRLGDVLIVQTGALGESAIVGEEFVGAGCHALLIARVDRSLMTAEFLWHCLQSGWGRELLLREQTGALHPHLEAGKIRDVQLPVPSLSTQGRIVAVLEETKRQVESATGLAEAQITLLVERKHALITAAVTGQFDVTAARAVA